MNGKALLEAVADTYQNLKSLALEAVSVSESGDEFSRQRQEQRVRAFFVAPDKVRIEQGGQQGTVTVSNGTDLHHYFAGPKRYSKSMVQNRDSLPGWFRPELPMAGGTVPFLFSRIADGIIQAEVLREEPITAGVLGSICQVVSVLYEPPPYPGWLESSSPVTFWVDPQRRLILKMESTATHRLPAHEDTHTSKHFLSFTSIATDEPIAPETFEYAPLKGALDASDPQRRGGRISVGGGGGGRFHRPDRAQSFESWHSHDWAGETLIEQSKLKWQEVDLHFERRLTVSEDRNELQIIERITGPRGQTERALSLPIR